MQERLVALRSRAKDDLAKAKTLNEIEYVRVHYLGRKGAIKEIMKAIPSLPPEEKSMMGKMANQLKLEISDEVEGAKKRFSPSSDSSTDKTPRLKNNAQDAKGSFDLSLPGKRQPYGHIHPITQTINEIKSIFSKLGFAVEYGPELEQEYYNFDALNVPPDHPSREDFDTFYLDNKLLLRSQTSTVQIRTMKKRRPPIRMIAPGKVYRPDTVDARHASMFHQIEGLLVDEGVSFQDLKYALTSFSKIYFGQDIKMRFRPSFFPFTEPSAEVDISCSICNAKGCRVCSHSGWVEVLGAGMVDPNVFEAVGYDAEKYTGFAFGMGVERLTMLRYGIDDIRLFFENDLRFLSQF
ncbi:MAG: phenylalanine--tRNA ligase subunit alpha [Candidatus Scalindua sp. AMX11]|nr:MAG: phenylalanine--tRNA ligase subunit alpha [Candidatus Scalindua sp.]NOG85261.1 phenylalanine--tRNA ligase subunit alpha [Planctomycetota bacterium]RZV81530.1 MAG: phenylalanine--tRNA ligase subunit alpha [Candidatus Scalindua sp. SCAELEC01]TDE65489.1 MAG: phenylalanine--tRNA ligase subunit alpha [Candidatus Scalindua sp. AMX11]